VAAQIGYCGLDRLRQPLTGAEIRACWEAWPAGALRPETAPTIGPARRPHDDHHREFVEVGVTAVAVAEDEPRPAIGDPTAVPASEPAWSLWGDPDRSI
jgi:hypothetical protein